MALLTNYKGILIGEVYVIKDTVFEVGPKSNVMSEIETKKLDRCIQEVNEELLHMKENSSNQDIIDAHIQILNDPVCIKEVKHLIDESHYNAEYAYNMVMDHFIEAIKTVEDDYIKERYIDLLDVKSRVLRSMIDVPQVDVSNKIILKDIILPSDIMEYKDCIAFVSRKGTLSSHTAILAESNQIPFIISDEMIEGQVIIDTLNHVVIPSPNEAQQEKYLMKQKEYIKHLEEYKKQHLEDVSLYINGPIDDYTILEEYNVDGMGLLRTEFLFKERYLGEQEQYSIYQEIVSKCHGKQCTFRTLDLGGDKVPSIYHFDFSSSLRGLDLLLEEKNEFEKQLRSLLQVQGQNIRVMFPLVNSKLQFLKALKIVDKCKNELLNSNKVVNQNITFGSMIETMTSIANLEEILEVSDFISIGSNDLLSDYTKIDRFKESDLKLYYEPGFLRLLNDVIIKAKQRNTEVSLCGEIGGNHDIAYLLREMGINGVSMNVSHVLVVKQCLLMHQKEVLHLVLKASDKKEVQRILKSVLE
jgi:phosphotransferase system enzyme I (PtsI)